MFPSYQKLSGIELSQSKEVSPGHSSMVEKIREKAKPAARGVPSLLLA
jgi:hypothetical protein